MRILKNRTTIGVACIILSFLICFLIAPLLGDSMKARTEIIRVTKDVKKGEVITSDKIEKITVGGYNLPENIFKESEDVVGKFANGELQKGDYILFTKVANKPTLEDEYLYKLSEGKQAISVSIMGFAEGLSGKLRSGDIITLISTEYADKDKTIVYPELQYVEVLAATSNKGEDNEELDANKDKSEDGSLPSTVTLLVNSEQAKKIAELEACAKVHISLVCRGDEEKAKELLDEQELIISLQDIEDEDMVDTGGEELAD